MSPTSHDEPYAAIVELTLYYHAKFGALLDTFVRALAACEPSPKAGRGNDLEAYAAFSELINELRAKTADIAFKDAKDDLNELSPEQLKGVMAAYVEYGAVFADIETSIPPIIECVVRGLSVQPLFETLEEKIDQRLCMVEGCIDMLLIP